MSMHDQTEETDSTRPNPPYPHVPHSRMTTGPWFFFVTKPLPFHQILLFTDGWYSDHTHVPRFCIHTGPWVFFGTKPLSFRQDSVRPIDFSVSDTVCKTNFQGELSTSC
jgi:hypothetical protein